MVKFLNESDFWETVNQWVRDGSNIYQAVDTMDGTTVALKGKDGCTEELILFHDKNDYDRCDMIEGDKK